MIRNAGWILVLTAVLTLGLTGCAPRSTVMLNYPHARFGNLTESPHEHYQRVSNIAAMDGRALVDDLDLLFMTDRPTRLTRWTTR